ncbi:MAG TPA: glycogen debranching N-terminal domain-containing protein [Candidatus Dormibacteraeota bacterium]
MNRVVMKEDRYFAVSAPDGSMRADGPDGHGLWWGDTRFLSDYHLLIDGHEPEPVGVQVEAGSVALELAVGALRIRRERYVDAGLHERITITNPGPSRTVAGVELVCGTDFAAMLAVRGIVSLPPPPPAARTETDRGIELRDSNGSRRVTEVIIRPPGNQHRLELGPGEELVLEVDVVTGSGYEHATFEGGLDRIRAAYRQWSADCVAIETDNPALNELLQQSRDDMRMLCDQYPTGLYPNGGLPWFAVPFGRDALFTSMFALPMNPQIARGTLRYLAAHQGKQVNRDTEEQPGKILHEVRTGDLVDRGLWPGILFGTVDATPLYLCALANTLDWTADTELFDELWPAAEAALEWCATYGDPDHDGYVEYSGGRARNQGWKDSDDALTHVDGTPAPLPAAICEVQGYLYQGLLAMARKRPELKTAAADLRRRFNQDFWMARERFVAQGLDGGKRQVEAVTSNPGHCLWTGILPPARARAIASRLVSPDLFTGWGIRTLSSSAINYDPSSYHNGSVWPHDSAIAAAGLRRYGMAREAGLVARSILDAGMAFPDRRMPELWCGTDRAPGAIPDDYRNSCSPQNWAAGSTFSLVTTLLGLEADATRGRLRIAPIETPLWRRIEVTGLHFAGHRIDFEIDGTDVKWGRLPKGITVETGGSLKSD